MSPDLIQKALLNPELIDEKFKNLPRDTKMYILDLLEEEVQNGTTSMIENLMKMVRESEIILQLKRGVLRRRPLFELATQNKQHFEVIDCLLGNGYNLMCDSSSMGSAFALPRHSIDLRGTATIFEHFQQFPGVDQAKCEETMKLRLRSDALCDFPRYFRLELKYFRMLYFENWTESIIVMDNELHFILRFSPIETMLFILEKLKKERKNLNYMTTTKFLLPAVMFQRNDITVENLKALDKIDNINTDDILSLYFHGNALQSAIERELFEVTLFFLNKVNFEQKYRTRSFLCTFQDCCQILKAKLSLIDFHKKESKKKWLSALVLTRGFDQVGCEKKMFPEGCRRREKNKSKIGKESQILRHMATQLFYRWKYNQNVKSLQEVQIMKASIIKRSNLNFFAIAVNPADAAEIIVDRDNIFQPNSSIITHVTEIYDQPRSERYSRKLQSECTQVELTGLVVQKMVKSKDYLKFPDFPANYHSFQDLIEINGKIFFLVPSGFSNIERHGEEYLCDFADFLRGYYDKYDEQIVFSIYGKKRPCISCSGRMKASNVADYNPNFGYFWKHGIEDQSEGAARCTMHILLNEKPPHVTFQNNKKLEDYDTDSE